MALLTIPRKVVIPAINVRAPLMGIVARLALPMPAGTRFPAPDRSRRTPGKQSAGNGRLRWAVFMRSVVAVSSAVFAYHSMLFYICKVKRGRQRRRGKGNRSDFDSMLPFSNNAFGRETCITYFQRVRIVSSVFCLLRQSKLIFYFLNCSNCYWSKNCRRWLPQQRHILSAAAIVRVRFSTPQNYILLYLWYWTTCIIQHGSSLLYPKQT